MDFIVFLVKSVRQSTGIYSTYRFHLDSSNVFYAPSNRVYSTEFFSLKKGRNHDKTNNPVALMCLPNRILNY